MWKTMGKTKITQIANLLIFLCNNCSKKKKKLIKFWR